MIAIFDLDYTLLDTNMFKEKLAQAMEISEKDYNSTYTDFFYKKNNIRLPYHPSIHLNYLIKKNKVSLDRKEVIEKNILKVVENINKMLFIDAEKVLQEIKKRGYELILITWGNGEWQKLKIDNLKIKKYFNKIIRVDKSKEKCIDFLENSDDRKIIINDNLKESLKLKEKLKSSEIFLIKSKHSRNHKNLLEEHSLGDFLKLINN
ncbi:HAD family hydrolase [bacterium]|nr:HAD family hydrolase [bacterium]